MASLVTLIIQSIITNISNKRKFQNDLLCNIYNDRLNAFKELYSELVKYKKYFTSFIETGNEFIEYNNPKDFAPLTITENLIKFFDEREIFFDEDIVLEFNEMISSTFMLNNLALYLCQDYCEEFIETISPSCENATKAIEKFQVIIKKVIGIEKINKEIKY